MDNSTAPRAPATASFAEFVKVQRKIYGWKREALAALAKVSLSTIERVERGESVRPSSLEKLALALNLQGDAFTRPRVALPPEEAIAVLADSFSWLNGKLAIEVSPLRFEAQLRALSATDAAVFSSDLVGEDAASEVGGLREWLDLLSFVRAQDGTVLPKRERSFRLRGMYKDVLAAVVDVERKYQAVCLAGTYEAQLRAPWPEAIRVAVIAVRSRVRNPAAIKLKHLLIDKTLDIRAAMEGYLKAMD